MGTSTERHYVQVGCPRLLGQEVSRAAFAKHRLMVSGSFCARAADNVGHDEFCREMDRF
jgi:hypothetical protein